MSSSNSPITAEFLIESILPTVCQIAYEAGQNISQYYHQEHDVEVQEKADGTPVTEADQMADEYIAERLQRLTPDIPLVTEESVAKVPFAVRKDWQTYWLVDPLDGTKEFIEGTGEYSVNIALVHNHHPVLGVVYGPEQGNLYFAAQSYPEQPGEIQQKSGKIGRLLPVNVTLLFDWPQIIRNAKPLSVAQHPSQRVTQNQPLRVAVSRRHGGTLQHFMAQLGNYSKVKMGSALKTCLVADGKADVYPRFGPTSLWDTAAAQCILEVAGGKILNAAGHSLEYVQTESLLNPFFLAVSHEDYNWPAFPEIF